jgi:hypothetical protein
MKVTKKLAELSNHCHAGPGLSVIIRRECTFQNSLR